MSQTSVVSMSAISYTPPQAHEPLFSGVSVTFAKGWTAVAGDNGIGKSTLMRLLSGQLQPDSGMISPSPKSMVIAYCPQETDIVPPQLESLMNDWSAFAIEVRQLMDIDEEWLYRYGELSGGEAKRVQLACAISAQPDVLILDEPTNHVDAETKRHIVEALQRYQGIGIVVSHDVDLIEALCTRTVMFERRHISGRNITVVELYRGAYEQAVAQRDANDASRSSALAAARNEVARLQLVRADRMQAIGKVEAAKRRSGSVDPKDHDARNAHKAAKSTSLDKGVQQRYTQLEGRLKAAQSSADALSEAAKRYDTRMEFDGDAIGHGRVLCLDRRIVDNAMAAHGIDNYVVDMGMEGVFGRSVQGDPVGREDMEIQVIVGDHIGISGVNGAGKSTLVQAMVHVLPKDKTCLYIEQNTDQQVLQDAIDRLHALDEQQRSRVLSAYARLNADPDRLLAGASPSPGELRKLMLCLGLVGNPRLIIMDEPTNHMDIQSKESLAQALADYPGAVVVISHDDWFLNKVADKRWILRRSE